MDISRLDNMTKGWFIGDFEPSVKNTKEFEVAVKKYAAGDYESEHYHAVASEYTVIVEGEAEMLGKRVRTGDIILVEPHESTDFRAVVDTITVVVKTPSIKNDKFLGNPGGKQHA